MTTTTKHTPTLEWDDYAEERASQTYRDGDTEYRVTVERDPWGFDLAPDGDAYPIVYAVDQPAWSAPTVTAVAYKPYSFGDYRDMKLDTLPDEGDLNRAIRHFWERGTAGDWREALDRWLRLFHGGGLVTRGGYDYEVLMPWTAAWLERAGVIRGLDATDLDEVAAWIEGDTYNVTVEIRQVNPEVAELLDEASALDEDDYPLIHELVRAHNAAHPMTEWEVYDLCGGFHGADYALSAGQGWLNGWAAN